MRLAIGLMLASIATGQALALDLSPINAGKAFEKAAAAWGAKGIHAKEQKCTPGDDKYTCRFLLTGGVTLIAMAPYDTDRVSGIGLYFTGESEPIYYFVEVGAFLGLLDPAITQAERKRIAKKLIDGATSGGAAEIGDSYTITSGFEEGIGVSVLADVK